HLSGVARLQIYAQAARCLRGQTRGPFSLDLDEEQLDEPTGPADNQGEARLKRATFHILSSQACYVLGAPELAWRPAGDAAALLPYLGNLYIRADFHLYAALAAASLGRGAGPPEKAAFAGRIREHLDALERWSKSAPMNFQHKRDLVAAELAQLEE